MKMLTRVLGCLAVAMLATNATASRAAAPEVLGSLQGVYLALGDSVAAGVGASAPARTGFVARAFGALQTSGVAVGTLANLANSGETSASFLSRQMDRALAAIADSGGGPEVVSLNIGGNDVLRLLFGGPCLADPASATCGQQVVAARATVAQNYPAIMAKLTDALATKGRRGVLFVHTTYNPFSGTGTPYEAPVDEALLGSDGIIDCDGAAAEPGAMGLNDIIACVGASHGAHVVDVQPHFAGRGLELTLIARRDIHPNDAGHQVIASAFVEAVLATR